MDRKRDTKIGGERPLQVIGMKNISYDPWNIISHPHLSEKSMTMVDEENTLVFVVDNRATKPQIRRAVEDLFDVAVKIVNTQNSRKGRKKAYVMLNPDYEALDVATKLGMF